MKNSAICGMQQMPVRDAVSSDKDEIVMVSVVRDMQMYERLVRGNRHCSNCRFVAFDNRQTNDRITNRYNFFFDSFDFKNDAWFVFLHEDCEMLEPIGDVLEQLPKDRIYGVVGCRKAFDARLTGYALNSDKSGGSLRFLGRPVKGLTEVLTTDCYCMAVHSSLVNKYNLRFDANLSYDFYTEAFEIDAYEEHGIPTCILPVKARHYSYGNMNNRRFFSQRRYLWEKYKEAKRVYRTTTCQLFGPHADIVRMKEKSRCCRKYSRLWNRLAWFFWKAKYSPDGYRRIRILGIPIKFRHADIAEWCKCRKGKWVYSKERGGFEQRLV